MYDSAILGLLYGKISSNGSSSFEVSEALFNGIKLSDGSNVLNAFNNATGGLTVDLGAGEGTATIADNVYGSQTIFFSDPTMAPIVGRSSLFGETFSQSAINVGSIEPSFMGDGLNIIMDNGVTYTGMMDIYSKMKFTSNSLMNVGSFTTPAYLISKCVV